MSGVQFGEWPYLEEKSEVNSCAYSPDGKTCAMGLYNGLISVYNTLSLKKIHTLRGHKYSVNSVAYSPSGTQIASGSLDKTVRLW
ncbi:WD40 repeat-like protein, partial [Linnemannia elongata AG-77]